jgi:hypothetical protein
MSGKAHGFRQSVKTEFLTPVAPNLDKMRRYGVQGSCT